MTFPSILLGTVIALIFGCGFHFWRGGGLKWLLAYNLFAIIGFWAGHYFGLYAEWEFIKLGPINLGAAVIGSVIFMLGGYWLSMASVEINKRK